VNINLVSHIASVNLFRKQVNSFRSNTNTILNLSALHKPILIRSNNSGSHKSKPICQNLRNNLKFKISNNNWPVIFNRLSTQNLRNKRYHIIVHSRENPVLFKNCWTALQTSVPIISQQE